MEEKYYKILDADGASALKKFDYRPYLPGGELGGEWLPKIENPSITNGGYYVTKYWNMWYSRGARIFEVECAGLVSDAGAGVEHQACCETFRFLRDVTARLEPSLAFDEPDCGEKCNTGVGNTGLYNTGTFNCGNYNAGTRNTGSLNLGDFNTGDSNSGMDNVGDSNRGSCNGGSRNVGHSNCGNGTIGSFNTGSFNRGNGNTGSFNVGSHNSGKWNLGSYNVGFFNTKEPPLMMFDKPAFVSRKDIRLPKWLNCRDPKAALKTATKAEIEAALALPNFDYEIFFGITGVSKADIDARLKQIAGDF